MFTETYFFGTFSKNDVLFILILEKKIWQHLSSIKGYSRDYLKPDFRSLGQLYRGLSWGSPGSRATFSALFVKLILEKNSVNISYHKGYPLRIILSSISGVCEDYFSFHKGLSTGMPGYGDTFWPFFKN